MTEADIVALNKNKKVIKNLAKKYDAFLASDTLIKKLPRIMGPGLNRYILLKNYKMMISIWYYRLNYIEDDLKSD